MFNPETRPYVGSCRANVDIILTYKWYRFHILCYISLKTTRLSGEKYVDDDRL